MDTLLRGDTNNHSDRKESPEEEEKNKRNLLGKNCFLYIDDLLIFSKGTLDDHLSTLKKVIDRLSKFGLRAKATKVSVAMHELKFLGYMVGRQGKWADPEKISAIERIPIPKGKKSKSQLSSFLGLCSFYRGQHCRPVFYQTY